MDRAAKGLLTMKINSSRFGEIEVDDQRVMTFPKGLLGFPEYQQYVLIEAGQDSYFWWLQSVDKADLAFIVTDPTLFIPTYKVPVKAEQIGQLNLNTVDDAQVLVIVNKRGETLTGNLQGPLVINVKNCFGEQLVLSDRRFTTRVPLVEVKAEVHAQSA
jgi:flagellar assembly factor FliW